MYMGGDCNGLGMAPRIWANGVKAAAGTRTNWGPSVGFRNANRVRSAKVSVRQLPSAPRTFGRSIVRGGGSSWRPGTVHTFMSAGDDYNALPYEVGLGGFKLKKAFKSVAKAVSKPVKQVAKIAVKPAALVAGSSLHALGLRKAADKLGKNLGLSERERKITKTGGTVIQAGAVVTAGIVAAPAIGAGLTTAGKAALTAGKFVAGKGMVLGKALAKSKLVGAAAQLFAKKQAVPAEEQAAESSSDDGSGYGPLDFSGVTSAAQNIAAQAQGYEAAPYEGPIQNFQPTPGGPGVPSDEGGAAPEAVEGEKKANPLAVLAPIGALLLLA
jgi:hypothetical protein